MTTTPDSVLAFLQENPDFLTQHPELFPAQQGNVVNFQNVMVNKLRQDKKRAEDRQRLLVDNARNNMTIQARIQAAIVRVLEARDLVDLTAIISQELPLMLQVDVALLLLENPANNDNADINTLPMGTIQNIMGDHQAMLQANVNGDATIFGPMARLVRSQALLRLHVAAECPEAMLAFGSRDPLLFNDTQGTELISFLADVIERLIFQLIAR